MYIGDKYNHRIRKVAVSTIISTIAGTGVGDYSGDNDAATGAKFNTPYEVAVDSSGNKIVVRQDNNTMANYLFYITR